MAGSLGIAGGDQEDKEVSSTQWEIKVFVLSDASNGYVYRFQIYAGKNMDQGVEVGLCSVVLELMEGV